MKVITEQNGNLKITPETELENYALDKWYEGYISNGNETLTVNLFHDASEDQKKFHTMTADVATGNNKVFLSNDDCRGE